MSLVLKQSKKLDKDYDQFLAKANKIHLELLSFIQNEINEKKQKAKIFFSFSSHKKIENDKFNQHKDSTNNEQKSNNTLVNSDDDEDYLEESSDMSCDEENIVDI